MARRCTVKVLNHRVTICARNGRVKVSIDGRPATVADVKRIIAQYRAAAPNLKCPLARREALRIARRLEQRLQRALKEALRQV